MAFRSPILCPLIHLGISVLPHRLKLSSHGRVSFLEAFSDTAIGSQEPDWTADRTRSQATF